MFNKRICRKFDLLIIGLYTVLDYVYFKNSIFIIYHAIQIIVKNRIRRCHHEILNFTNYPLFYQNLGLNR